MKIQYPLAVEDLQRFGIELARNENNQPMFVVTFLSKKTNIKENYKDYKAFFNAVFKVPVTVLVHTEDVVKEEAADDMRRSTVDISEATLEGAKLEA
jgi:predicted RND superfamily exporter protein